MLVVDILNSMCVVCYLFFFFFKQKTAYEMRISDWSSDVCSSDLSLHRRRIGLSDRRTRQSHPDDARLRDPPCGPLVGSTGSGCGLRARPPNHFGVIPKLTSDRTGGDLPSS